MRARSILWIGPGASFAAELAVEAPLLDVVWEPSAERGGAHPLERFDAVVLDADDAARARSELARLQQGGPTPPVLLRVAPGAAEAATELLAAGAASLTLRGERGGTELLERIERLLEGRARPPHPPSAPASAVPAPPTDDAGIVGTSPALRETLGLLACAARSPATVLLQGETGTGKELLARALHGGSPRRAGPFVAANCAAFTETLLESELFGHVRGSFTGADRDRKGLVEEAHGGTLFLDEVSETSRPFQAKLLRVLQERELRPVGAARPRRVDVRVVAATNRDLARQVEQGGFRPDLYYRLAVFPIRVPPLRERRPDVVPLAQHLLARHGSSATRLAPESRALLEAHHWPGNVRELENEVQRALAVAPPGSALEPHHFSERLRQGLPPPAEPVSPGESLRESVDRVEAWLIRRALDANAGRRAETARRLGLTREGLYKKMKRLGIE